MGVDIKKSNNPPLPAPTETESTILTAAPTGTDLGTDLGTDVSGPGDEKSSYSIPDDGTPVTIRAGHRASKSQTSLLIEYFEGGKSVGSGSGESRKPSVRVRLTPSSKRRSKSSHGGDRIQITSGGTRKVSLSRRSEGRGETLSSLGDHEDASSYASATEESNVSRNPIEVEIDRSGRRRRPASPLIPAADSKASYVPPASSDISAIPTDSFLDGSGGTTSLRMSDSKSNDYLTGAALAGLGAAAVAADKARNRDSRESREARERPVVNRSSRDKEKERERRSKSSKSRTSSVSKDDKYAERSSRRSSRGHIESMVSVPDSSVVSSVVSQGQHSVRSGASKASSINNPKLLETVEDAIRRLILPELNALKREQSRRGGRRDSVTSSTTTTSRDDYASDKRRSNGTEKMLTPRDSLKASKERRDREARNKDFDDSSALSHESVEDLHHLDDTPGRSTDHLKAAAAGAALGAAAVAAHEAFNSPAEDKQRSSRRRRRAEMRSRGAGSDQQAPDYEDSDLLSPPAPPMPLMSDVNASDVTRASILSADTDRPHSASEELTPVRDLSKGPISLESTPTPSRTPVNTLQALGAQHANLSHGDLKALPRQRTGQADEYVLDDYGKKVPSRNNRKVQEEDDDYEDDESESGRAYAPQNPYDYYSTQDVPPPLNYVPYQPERRGLSPIPSVSGYTDAGSEILNRESRATHRTIDSVSNRSPRQDGSVRSPVNRNFVDDDDDDDRSLRSDAQGSTTSPVGSELDRITSGKAVRAVGLNPGFENPPGIESHVASLVDGSMLEGSALTTDSDLHGNQQYYGRESMVTVEEEHSQRGSQRGGTPAQRSVGSHHDYADERGESPVSERSREEYVEYDLDEYGRKVPVTQASRQSPTASEAAITTAAVAAAVLRAQHGKTQQTTQENEGQWEGAGVQRNRSFKERTQNGHRPGIDHSLSAEKLAQHNQPKFVTSGLPDPNDPMPEIGGWNDDDLLTNPSLLDGDAGRDDGRWGEEATPRQNAQHLEDDMDYEPLDRQGQTTPQPKNQNHSRQVSQEHDEWYRTSEDRKRDTLITNPYEGTSPIANLPGINDTMLGGYDYNADHDDGYDTRSPLGLKDEGYISQGPNKTPDVQVQEKGKGLMGMGAGGLSDDPFYNPRQVSGMSHGMASPLYDPATGTGVEQIESKDIIALMQHLMVRDAQRSARDTEILVTLVRSATEMRNNMEVIKSLLADTEDVIITEVKENTEKTVTRAINGPRPYPGNPARSLHTVGSVNEELNAKKRSIFRRALFKGLGAKSENDLGRIEDMLFQLLNEVDVLKAQTAPGGAGVAQDQQSFMQPEIQYEQDQGYEPEGHAGTSTASHPSQSGLLSIQSRATSAKPGFDRRTSANRISTVPEDNEEEYQDMRDNESAQYDNPEALMTPAHVRSDSVPLATPPQNTQAQTSMSNENTPQTEGKKKSRSSWFRIPKISRWSETTASSGVPESRRHSKQSSKGEDIGSPNAPSQSGSLDNYENYQLAPPHAIHGDKLHTGFSERDLTHGQEYQENNGNAVYGQMTQSMPQPPNWVSMTPEDPKYKAHRDSLNLQHPQPRQGQTERFKAALESQALGFDSPMSPRSAEWAGSATSLNRLPRNQNRDSYGSAAAEYQQLWTSSPAAGNITATSGGPPRPPKEPMERHSASPGLVRGGTGTPPHVANKRVNKLQKQSPLPHQSVESGYGTMTQGVPTASYISQGQHSRDSRDESPRLENRNLSGALDNGVSRRLTGPRPMTPTGRSSGGVASPLSQDGDAVDGRRKRDTFGTLGSQDTDTF